MPEPTLTETPKSNKLTYILLATFIIILLAGIGYMFYTLTQKPETNFLTSVKEKYQAATTSESQPQKTKPSPSPMYLAPGKQTYNISHGEKVTGPKPTKAIIDPIDPAKNQDMTITIDITSDSDLTKSDIIIVTDNQQQPLKLKLISGDQKQGTWQTKTKLKDTYLYNYRLMFDLKNSTGTYTNGLTFRQ